MQEKISPQNSGRVDYMDLFRAMGIICMVMGHIGFGDIFDKWSHAFHMPMFFFVSGFFYKERAVGVAEYTKKKAKSLLVPYAFFGGFHYLVYLRSACSLTPLLHLVWINTLDLPIAGALWFLTALFFTEVLYFILDRYNCKCLIVPLVLIGSLADQHLPSPLPWSLSPAFVGLGLYWAGNFVKRKEDKFAPLLNMRWWQIGGGCGITGALIFVNGYINMREGLYAFLPLFWLNALGAIFEGISAAKQVEQWMGASPAEKWLKSIGRDSIVYVCLNQFVIFEITKILPANNLVFKTAVLIFSMACLYVLSLLFTKTGLKVLIGKK